MAEAPDLELLCYRRIRELLEADDTGWASEIDEGNRIWYDVEQPNDPAKPTTADGDHPSSKLRARTGSSGFFTNDVTFATHSGDACDALEKGTFVFQLTMTSQLLGQQEQSRLRKLAENVIRKAGPRIGLPYVVRVTTRWDTEEIDVDRELGTKRERTTMDISLEYEARVKFITGEVP